VVNKILTVGEAGKLLRKALKPFFNPPVGKEAKRAAFAHRAKIARKAGHPGYFKV
jgi:hypothetical protein